MSEIHSPNPSLAKPNKLRPISLSLSPYGGGAMHLVEIKKNITLSKTMIIRKRKNNVHLIVNLNLINLNGCSTVWCIRPLDDV